MSRLFDYLNIYTDLDKCLKEKYSGSIAPKDRLIISALLLIAMELHTANEFYAKGAKNEFTGI